MESKRSSLKASLMLQAPIPSRPPHLQGRYSTSNSMPVKSSATINPENYNSFQVRIPKNTGKHHSIMKFNTKLDISAITQANMQRQRKTTDSTEYDMPKFGAGSEYGREQRLEAKRKKMGYVKKVTKDEDLPWLLTTGGKTGKNYKGVKEANISQNAAYYIFSKCEDGSYEAHPVESFYRFTPIINYRTLTADEAEEEFSLRNKTINYFSLMVKKRLVDTDEKISEDDNVPQKVKSKVDKLQLYNDDDLGDMSNDEGDEEEEHEDEEKFQKAKKKLKSQKAKKDDNDGDIRETEDGHFDSKEVDYMSDSSSSDEEVTAKQSERRPEAEDDLNAQLNPDSEDDSELEDDKLSKGGLILKGMLKENDDSSGDDDDDDEEMDEDQTKSAVLLQGQKKKGKKTGSNSSTSSSSRSTTPTKSQDLADKTVADAARKLKDMSSGIGKKRPKSSPAEETPSKKLKRDAESPSIHRSASGSSLATRSHITEPESPASRGSPVAGITEDTVRRYLSHKPMTTKDLLRKFKTTKTGLTSEQTVQQIAMILKKIQPEKNQVKGKLYLSLKKS